MFAGGLLLGATLIGFALWLHWNEHQGWPGESYDREMDHDHLCRRRRSRRRVHWLIAGCGLLIILAAIGGPETPRLWIGCWLSVFLSLMTVIALAGFDGLRTYRYHAQQLPELRRRSLQQNRSPGETTSVNSPGETT